MEVKLNHLHLQETLPMRHLGIPFWFLEFLKYAARVDITFNILCFVPSIMHIQVIVVIRIVIDFS